jgi:hypothetical protein
VGGDAVAVAHFQGHEDLVRIVHRTLAAEHLTSVSKRDLAELPLVDGDRLQLARQHDVAV